MVVVKGLLSLICFSVFQGEERFAQLCLTNTSVFIKANVSSM